MIIIFTLCDIILYYMYYNPYNAHLEVAPNYRNEIVKEVLNCQPSVCRFESIAKTEYPNQLFCWLLSLG